MEAALCSISSGSPLFVKVPVQWFLVFKGLTIALFACPCDVPFGGTIGSVKSGNFGHQINSDKHLQTVEIQMRRLDFHCLLS